MKKVIFWNNNKSSPFKLTPRYICRLQDLGFKSIPTKIGMYNNSDNEFISAIEQLRTETPLVLKEELSKCINHQSIQSHFMQVFTSFEAFAVQFWIMLTETNPHIVESSQLENLYHAVIYSYSFDDLKQDCNKWNIILSEEMQKIFQSLVVRRNVVNDLREKRDKSHDDYLQFCKHGGMRTFSHIPPVDGFKIVEYDETKYRAKIQIQTNSLGVPYEELELIPI